MTPDRAAPITSQPPPGRPPARGRSEGTGDPFGTLLDQHQARTAAAEGQKKVSDSRIESKEERPQATGHGPQDADKASKPADKASKPADKPAKPASDKPDTPAADKPAAQPAVAAAVAVIAQPVVPVAAPVVTVAAEAVSVSQVAAQAVDAGAKGQAAQVAAPVLAATATATAAAGEAQAQIQVADGAQVPAQPGVDPKAVAQPGQQAQATQPATAPALPDVPVTAAKPATPATPDVKAQETATPSTPAPTAQASTAPAQPKAPVQAHDAPAQQQNAGQQQQLQQQQQAPADTPAPAAPAQAQAAEPVISTPQSAPSPVAAPVQPAAQAAAPASAPAPAAPVPGMRLAQAVETVQQIVRISQSNGITQARVQLHPEDLGQINIHLRSTPDGVVAKVVADASQAAAVLRDGGDELRRQLAQQGINLTHFDVGTAGQEQRGAAFGNGGSQQRSSHGNNAENPAPDTQHPTPVDETTIALPNGVLVDVLA